MKGENKKRGNIFGKLTFYESWPDRVMSKVHSETSNKQGGIQMIRNIMEFFSITIREVIIDYRKKQREEHGLFKKRDKDELD